MLNDRKDTGNLYSEVAWIRFTEFPLPSKFRNNEQRLSKKAYQNKRNNNESVKKTKLVPGLRRKERNYF